MHYPSAELVAVAWAKTIGGDIDPTKVATTLPGDASVWGATGFTTVTVLAGNPNHHVPLSGPVVVFDCWAAALNSNKSPWGQAGAMAAAVHWASHARTTPEVVMPDGFHPARLLATYPVDGPRRIPSDPAGYARVQVSVAFAWTTTAGVGS